MSLLVGASPVAGQTPPTTPPTPPGATSQAAPGSTFDPLETFAPLTLPEPATAVRSGAGTPGPAYWQNRADYSIAATLDPVARTLTGEATIAYVNNSPDVLDILWLQLDQNLYRTDARAAAFSSRTRRGATDGYRVARVEVRQGRDWVSVAPLIDDTRMRITLPTPLAPKGGKVQVRIAYAYVVPSDDFGGRTGWMPSDNGDIYSIAQWYPRMAVYDDLRGWDTLPYLANEFYLEYGDFDYAVTVPADMIVAGSGELTNAAQVLDSDQRRRLAEARASDRTVMIRTPDEVVSAHPRDGETRTWRFHMDHTRDVAFSASRAFVWDAARIDLPDGGTALAQSVYPVESVGQDAWSRSTEYLKHAVETFSAWYPYPWPNAINVAGPAAGMEYPGIVFDGVEDKGKTLFWITAHEIGHSWFPMIVGFDERRDAWMDEGFNTFIDVYESDAFENGVYGPKRDGEYAPGQGTPAEQIAALLDDRSAPAILTRADAIRETYRHPVTYFKSAFGLTLLREDILGPDRFDPAFRKFIRDWAYRHPKPSDFFRAMESAGGEDLSWFWRGWYLNNWRHDLAVTAVTPIDGDPARGAEVVVENRDRLVLPAILRVTFADGSRQDRRVPVETWLQNATHRFAFTDHGPVVSAEIDPDRRLPDAHRDNNSLALSR
ncbi:M1 family metallopeptidase [Brevundimonas sp.]|uniref:M1 family metallopeptidase n=1 Tax=Brevundimonas sp. TaxID=1871086 RepID=UPI0037BF98DD